MFYTAAAGPTSTDGLKRVCAWREQLWAMIMVRGRFCGLRGLAVSLLPFCVVLVILVAVLVSLRHRFIRPNLGIASPNQTLKEDQC